MGQLETITASDHDPFCLSVEDYERVPPRSMPENHHNMFQCLLFLLLSVLASPESLSFKPPKLTGEERGSILTPSNLQCDACIAVSYQIEKALFLAERLYNTNQLSESKLYETLDTTCSSNRFDNYGIKPVQGTNRLSGDGLAASDVPGMLSGGGKWPNRLLDKCGQVVGEVGEENVYAAYQHAATTTAKEDGTRNNVEFAKELCIRKESKDCANTNALENLISIPSLKKKQTKKATKKRKQRKKKTKKNKKKKKAKKKKRTTMDL